MLLFGGKNMYVYKDIYIRIMMIIEYFWFVYI